jgi:DNA-binding transcriptional MerR regulator
MEVIKMNTYKTSQIAAIAGIHPNTVRLYEEWGMISKPERQKNGYRIFTDLHVMQIKLARYAFQTEILQNGLKKKIIKVVQTTTKGDIDQAIIITEEYIEQLQQERYNAEEAIKIVQNILAGDDDNNIVSMKRKEVSDYLNISMDTLRNWEMNGLIQIKRKENGYRVYTNNDIKRLKIIRALRCANYSLGAILRMLTKLSQNPDTDILEALNTPESNEDIISACDRLIASINASERNAHKMIKLLYKMKMLFK